MGTVGLSTMPKRACDQVDQCIDAAAVVAQPVLREIRARVQRALPQALEVYSYRMPALRHAGVRGRVFFFSGAFKSHIGVYPPLHAQGELHERLKPYASGKGNLAFPLAQPMPYDLIEAVAVALARQYERP
jgi:uncharacterized protein YdhG (YjbR/CyaY superfamily)